MGTAPKSSTITRFIQLGGQPLNNSQIMAGINEEAHLHQLLWSDFVYSNTKLVNCTATAFVIL